jgi:hypothetical protein
MCAPRVTRQTSIRYSSSCHTRFNMLTAWYAGRGPAYQAVTYTEWYIPDEVLTKFDPPDDEQWVTRNM